MEACKYQEIEKLGSEGARVDPNMATPMLKKSTKRKYIGFKSSSKCVKSCLPLDLRGIYRFRET